MILPSKSTFYMLKNNNLIMGAFLKVIENTDKMELP